MILLKKLRFYRWYILGRLKIKKQIKNADTIKIIIGSATTSYKGWISTDLPHFNILKENDWAYFFKPNSIDNLLAEHVLEHLTHEQVENVLSYAFIYLKKGGCFRIAVPDKNNPDKAYKNRVKPKGENLHWGHLSFWSINDFLALTDLFNLNIIPIEYYDKDGIFRNCQLNEKNGNITRRLSIGTEPSLIIDFIKMDSLQIKNEI